MVRNTYQTAITSNDLNHQLNHRRCTRVAVDFSDSHRQKNRPGIRAVNEFSFRIAQSDDPRISGGQLLPAVFSWANPGHLAEQAREMRRIGEADVAGYVHHGLFWIAQ